MVISSDAQIIFRKINGHDHVTVGTGFLKTSLLGTLASILLFLLFYGPDFFLNICSTVRAHTCPLDDPSIPANRFAGDFLCLDLVTIASITFLVIHSLSVLSFMSHILSSTRF